MHIQNYLDEVNAVFKLHKKKIRVSLVCCSAASSFHFGDTEYNDVSNDLRTSVKRFVLVCGV